MSATLVVLGYYMHKQQQEPLGESSKAGGLVKQLTAVR